MRDREMMVPTPFRGWEIEYAIPHQHVRIADRLLHREDHFARLAHLASPAGWCIKKILESALYARHSYTHKGPKPRAADDHTYGTDTGHGRSGWAKAMALNQKRM